MANQLFDNIVYADAYESVLDTALDLQQFMEVDRTLAENAGMKKQVNTRKAIGDVEVLAMGEGNTEDIEVELRSKQYEVKTVQGRFPYFDEEVMTDPLVVDTGMKGLSEIMINNFTTDATEAWLHDSTQLAYAGASITFDDVTNALATMNLEREPALFGLVNPRGLADFRQNFHNELKYVEAFARTGYVGSVCSVPIYISKKVPDGCMFIGTKSATKLFIKKGTEIETERDANIRKTTVYARKVGLVAVVDETKIIRLGKPSTLDVNAPTGGSVSMNGDNLAANETIAVFDGEMKELGRFTQTNTSGAFLVPLSRALVDGETITVKTFCKSEIDTTRTFVVA